MKKLAMLFVLLVILASFSATFATSGENNNDDYTTDTIGYPIGTLEDQDGYLIADDNPTRGLPFSMSAQAVYNFLTTYQVNNKYFTGGAFDGFAGEGLLIEGSLTNSYGYNIRYGACYYNANNDTFYTVKQLTSPSGEPINTFIPKLTSLQNQYFYNQTTYYGHITNYSGYGYATGELEFSVSTGTNPNK